MCFYLQNQSWNASNDPPPDQNSPAAPWQSWHPPPDREWHLLVACTLVDVARRWTLSLWTYFMYWTLYMWWTRSMWCIVYRTCDICDRLVICIDAILVFVNYIFIVITACNIAAFIYILLLYLYWKTEKKEKKVSTLPSAYAKTLGKVAFPCQQNIHFAEC